MSRHKNPRFSSTFLRHHPEMVLLRDYPEMVAYMKEHEHLLLTHPWQGGAVNIKLVEFRNTQNENKVITRAGANGLLLQCPKCKQETCLPWWGQIVRCFLAWAMTDGCTYAVRCTQCPESPVLASIGILEKEGTLLEQRHAAKIEAAEAIVAWQRDSEMPTLPDSIDEKAYEPLEHRLSQIINEFGEPVLWIE